MATKIRPRLFSLWMKLMRVSYQTVYGMWRLSKAPFPMVSIFGGARLPLDDAYANAVAQLARMLSKAGVSVLTGGGPGVMEAASCGAVTEEEGERKPIGKTIGIGVRDLGEGRNPCVEDYFELDYFFARKWLLTRYSQAFVVFPGGFGTLDEMAEVLTLMNTKKLQRVPIVLYGVEFWSPFMTWLKNEVLLHNLIVEEDLELFVVTDDLNEAFNIVYKACLPFIEDVNKEERE